LKASVPRMSLNGKTNAVDKNNIVNSHLFGLNNFDHMNGHLISDNNQTEESE